MIPKKIHYCWLSDDPVPELLQNYIETWKKYMPEYEFILWNFDRFDINQSLWVRQAFEAKKYAFAADFIRLYAVYHHGGFYMDMDVEVVKSFDPLLNASYVFGFETHDSIEAGVFGAEKGNVFLGKCVDYYKDRSFIKENGEFDQKTLPRIMYETATPHYKMIMRNSLTPPRNDAELELLPYDFLTAKDGGTGIVKKTKNTYTVHHFAASWLKLSFCSRLRRQMKLLLVKICGGKLGSFLSDIVTLRVFQK